MDMVFKLERYRGVQSPGLVYGTDCCGDTTQQCKASQKGKAQRFYTKIRSAPKFRPICSEQQEYLEEDDKFNKKQEKTKEEKVASYNKEGEVT